MPTVPVKLHVDASARVAGVHVRLVSNTVPGAVTQYFDYAGSDAERVKLAPGVPYVSPATSTVLTPVIGGPRRMVSSMAAVTSPGTAQVAPGTFAELAEGVDAILFEGALLAGASLSAADVVTYTSNAQTVARTAAGVRPGGDLDDRDRCDGRGHS